MIYPEHTRLVNNCIWNNITDIQNLWQILG